MICRHCHDEIEPSPEGGAGWVHTTSEVDWCQDPPNGGAWDGLFAEPEPPTTNPATNRSTP